MIKFYILILFFSCHCLVASQSERVLRQVRSQLNGPGADAYWEKIKSGFLFQDNSENVDHLIRLLLTRNEDERIKKLAANGLHWFYFRGSLEKLKNLATKSSNYNEYTFPLFLKHNQVPNDEDLWWKLISSRDDSVARTAVEKLEPNMYESTKVVQALIQVIKNPNPRRSSLNEACIRKFREIPTNKSLPVLIRLLNNRDYKGLALETLEKITGQEFGFNIIDWQKWFGRNKNFTPIIEKPVVALDVATTPSDFDSSSYYSRYGEHYPISSNKEISIFSYPKPGETREKVAKSIYGISMEGEKILFFLDCSGSMSGQPYQLLKEEILYMAETMGDSYAIGVVFFPFNKKTSVLKPAKNTTNFRLELKEFLDTKGVGGPSPLLGAMEYAYDDLIDHDYQTIDTIYVISDGHIGSVKARAKIYGLNVDHKIPIHTICIRGSTDFLNAVSSDNQGRTYLVK